MELILIFTATSFMQFHQLAANIQILKRMNSDRSKIWTKMIHLFGLINHSLNKYTQRPTNYSLTQR